MYGLIKDLTSVVIIPGLLYLLYLLSKTFTVWMICRHPELSVEKVKYITRMMTKDKKSNK